MNNLDKQYIDLLQDILNNGVEKKDRTGTGTISVFGRQIKHKMSDGFPLLTTKKMPFKTITTELLWFLRGDTNIKYLVDNNCHIWDGDAYKNWKAKGRDFWEEQVDGMFTSELGEEEVDKISKECFINKIKTNDDFAKKWGELGPVYGKQWRNWDVPKILTIEKGKIKNGIGTEWGSWERNPIDQIANLINDLKTNPDSRRLMVNAWNVGEIDQMVLPPCHYGFQVYTRELSVVERMEYYGKHYMKENETKSYDELLKVEYDKLNVPTRAISLMWNQRSVDTFLGLPFNIASYGLLLMMLADEVNMVPDELIGNLGDVHLYSNHIEQAKEQIGREPYPLPKVVVQDGIYCSSTNDVILLDYQSHPAIKAPLSN
jgi:thymidylate synthase